MRLRLGFLFLLLGSLSFTIARADMDEPKTTKISHHNGLVIQLPDSLAAIQTPDGFRIQPAQTAELRSPIEMIVSLHQGSAPAGDWPDKRTLAGKLVRFRLDKSEGGSGGEMFTLTAWEAYSGGYILFRYSEQSEAVGTPDLAPAWNLMMGVGTRID